MLVVAEAVALKVLAVQVVKAVQVQVLPTLKFHQLCVVRRRGDLVGLLDQAHLVVGPVQ